jgi:hypothetical protein
LLRKSSNVLLAFVIGQLLALQASNRLRGAIGLAAILWLGFPFTLLSGSVPWQNVPLELGFIHCGDWLIKILLLPLTLWFINWNAEMRVNQSAVRAVQGNRIDTAAEREFRWHK